MCRGNASVFLNQVSSYADMQVYYVPVAVFVIGFPIICRTLYARTDTKTPGWHTAGIRMKRRMQPEGVVDPDAPVFRANLAEDMAREYALRLAIDSPVLDLLGRVTR